MHGGEVSERLFDHGLCLPSGSAMKDEERERVIMAFRTGFTS
jgi:dTDP-4-amino-4,6-dideoxygalactose transaminase